VSPTRPTSELRELAEEYARLLRSSFGDDLVSVVLFGSVARGDATERSDIDLLVVASGLPAGRLARQDRLREADGAIASRLDALRARGVLTDVSPILKTPDEAVRMSPLYLDLVDDAVLLCDKGGFFAAVLVRLRESLRRLGARRLVRDGVRYWELKPDYRPGEIFDL
jgi:uncharacterized protein